MERSTIAILAVIIIALIGGATAVFMWTGTPKLTQTDGAATGATKVAVNNSGSSWTHFVTVFENVPMKDGTTGTIFADVWIKPKPNGQVTFDLSKLAGYGSEPLPPGATVRLKAWKNLHREKPDPPGIDDLNLQMEGKPVFGIAYPDLTILQLPPDIKDNRVTTTMDPTEGARYLAGITAGPGCVYEEELLTVNPDGTVTITMLRPPILCEVIGGIV